MHMANRKKAESSRSDEAQLAEDRYHNSRTWPAYKRCAAKIQHMRESLTWDSALGVGVDEKAIEEDHRQIKPGQTIHTARMIRLAAKHDAVAKKYGLHRTSWSSPGRSVQV